MSEAGGQKCNGILDCMRTSVREEGVRVFFKGVMLNSVGAFPVNAATFLNYERLMKLFFSAWLQGNMLLPCTLKGLHSSTLSLEWWWDAVCSRSCRIKLGPTRPVDNPHRTPGLHPPHATPSRAGDTNHAKIQPEQSVAGLSSHQKNQKTIIQYRYFNIKL